MAYLSPAEYAAFGLETETADAWVTAASAMIDAHCRRPSLLSSSYTERMRIGAAQRAVLSYGPVIAITSLRGRLARRRDSLLELSSWGEFVANTFGLQNSWQDLEAADADIFESTVTLPVNLLGILYGEIEVTYTAGLESVPDAVKVACAQIVRNAQAVPALNVKSSKLDTLQTEYFSDVLLDSQVCALLRPYVAERLS